MEGEIIFSRTLISRSFWSQRNFQLSIVMLRGRAAGSGGDFLDEMGDACRVVFNGEGGFEDVAVAIADECDVFALGVVEGDAEDFAGVSGTLEDGADEGVLVSINGLGFA